MRGGKAKGNGRVKWKEKRDGFGEGIFGDGGLGMGSFIDRARAGIQLVK